MKKKFILALLFYMLANALSADSFYKLCPGVYLGGGLPALDYLEEKNFMDIFTVGTDVLAGYEFSLFNIITLGFYANFGFDTGLPNQPNLYYGVLGEVLWGGKYLKYGVAFGGGYNTSIDISLNNLDSFYFRVAVPVVFLGIFKASLCYDLYPDIGGRLGLLFHYTGGIKSW